MCIHDAVTPRTVASLSGAATRNQGLAKMARDLKASGWLWTHDIGGDWRLEIVTVLAVTEVKLTNCMDMLERSFVSPVPRKGKARPARHGPTRHRFPPAAARHSGGIANSRSSLIPSFQPDHSKAGSLGLKNTLNTRSRDSENRPIKRGMEI